MSSESEAEVHGEFADLRRNDPLCYAYTGVFEGPPVWLKLFDCFPYSTIVLLHCKLMGA